jgi:hypothetical protein
VESEQSATDFRQRLNRERDRLAGLRGELDQVEEELSGALLDRSLGLRVEARTIERAQSGRTDLDRAIAESAIVVGRLEDHVKNWDAAAADRRYADAVPRLADLAARARTLEVVYVEAAAELVQVAQALVRVRAESWPLAGQVHAHEAAHDLKATRIVEPARPFAIPPSLLTAEGRPYGTLHYWLASDAPPGWRRYAKEK